MVKLLSTLGLLLFTLTSNAQVINYVDASWKADINVMFTSKQYADIIVYKAKYQHETNNQVGYWWVSEGDNDGGYSSNKLNVYVVENKYQADYTVYITDKKYEVRVTNKYINEIK